MTVFLIVLAVWVAGWAYGARLALTYRMSKVVCPENLDLDYANICRESHGNRHGKPSHVPVPLGAIRERTVADGAAALGVGLAWPVLILAKLLTVTTPATPGESLRRLREQEVRIAEQAAEIRRLTATLGDRRG